ncbi:MAG TPA: polyhydroxyalkanoate synthesis regulator DNA-binding domain-containing protein [Sandaracinaceae bacterium LLY-WYZ-13_1]|nr:polyhydroxyalkanoate synthesis regulator DNA-binding domain-containing protein [Sandaracinaceae bacterium LLY-WYZ-13_1]
METQQHGDDEPTRLIKRYANRKLYDTRDSQYVTLLQIAHFVREGEDVTIIDNTTKEDLTNVTLAQIIYEEEKKGAEDNRAVAPVSTLRSLIQQSGERLMSSLREGPMGKLIARKEGDDPAEDEEAPVEAAPAEEEPAEDEAKAKKSVFESSKEALDELQRLADDRMRGLIGHAITHVQQLQNEVKRLQARIEELEDKLVTLGRRKGEDAEDAEDAEDGGGVRADPEPPDEPAA